MQQPDLSADDIALLRAACSERQEDRPLWVGGESLAWLGHLGFVASERCGAREQHIHRVIATEAGREALATFAA